LNPAPSHPRLLYLGYALPPGVSDLFPELSPAGHLIETCLVNSIRPRFDLRSVGISRLDFARLRQPLSQSPGLPHDLNLLDRAPSVWHRYRSVWRLRTAYRRWWTDGWQPAALLVCNMSPVYNAFVRGLARQANGPRRILYLADSTSLGLRTHWSKRLRYAFKPMTWLDDQMVGCFDACVAVSRTTEPWFRDRGVPWLWLPNGCDPARAVQSSPGPADGPIAFGYFGALPEYTARPRCCGSSCPALVSPRCTSAAGARPARPWPRNSEGNPVCTSTSHARLTSVFAGPSAATCSSTPGPSSPATKTTSPRSLRIRVERTSHPHHPRVGSRCGAWSRRVLFR